MKKLRLAAASFAVFTITNAAAEAADLGARFYGAPPPPPPVWSWTGFYIGGNIGGGWANTAWFEDATLSGSGRPVPVGFQDASVNSSGFLGGGQIGYDYQAGWAVFGVQADAEAAGINGSASCFPEVTGTVQSCTTRINALGTVTGRIGATFDRALFYVSGGWAWEDEKLQNPCSVGCPSTNAVFTGTASGWTIGAGIEYAFAPNWSAFAQYNYMGFGTRDLTFASVNTPATFTENIRENINVVKVGINYRFNWGGPVTTGY